MERDQIGEVYDAGREAVIDLVEGLLARTDELSAEMVELRSRLDQSSRNSSKPPSSDGYSKPPAKKRSLRRSSGKKPGGQPGSPGHHLKQVEQPDETIRHVPERCEGCGGDLAGADVVGSESRQVFDLPPLGLSVFEHIAERRRCACGHATAAEFPPGVGAPTQYGPWVRAYGIYLVAYQHLPYARAAEMLCDLFGARLSAGTLATIVASGAEGLGEFIAAVRCQLQDAEVCHFDETGARIEGKLRWIHSASTERLTLYSAHERRGIEAMDAAGVLPGFEGVAVHDGWTPYGKYTQATHALCAAHHLRELQAITDSDPDRQPWAAAMAALLRSAHEAVQRAKAHGAASLSGEALADLTARYGEIVASGHAQNPEPGPSGRRGRPRRPKALNLLRRLDSQRCDALRFAHDFRVPFDNNLAERDIRMVKLQQKISGCWRTIDGAGTFLAQRSYISTGRKQGHNMLWLLARLVEGDPWLPAAAEP